MAVEHKQGNDPPPSNPPAPRASPGVDPERALTGAANLVLYYNECDKVPDALVPLATKKALHTAVETFGEATIQRKAVEIAKERKRLGMSVADWCETFGALMLPEYRRKK